MTNIQNADLLKATRLTSAGRLTEATAALKRMLGGRQASVNRLAPSVGHSDPAGVLALRARAV